MSYADTRARIASAREAAAAHPIVRLANPQPDGLPFGHLAFTVGDRPPYAAAVLPILDVEAPDEILARYHARAVAIATGVCPMCEAVAGPDRDPEADPHAWSALQVVVRMQHAPGCPATFEDHEARWFPSLKEAKS